MTTKPEMYASPAMKNSTIRNRGHTRAGAFERVERERDLAVARYEYLRRIPIATFRRLQDTAIEEGGDYERTFDDLVDKER
jgi:hypothetical protein